MVGSFLFPVTLQLGETDMTEPTVASLADVFSNLLTNMVQNPVAAVASANYIAILFWSIVLGVALKLVASQGTISAVHDLAEMVSCVVKWIIQFAPFGILGLVLPPCRKMDWWYSRRTDTCCLSLWAAC